MQLYLAGYKSQKKTLSYTKPERKAFTTEKNKEALRIKKTLVSTFRYTECTPSNDQHLAVCGISLEEEYGIERLTPGDASATEKRRCHVQSILLEQENQRNAGCNDMQRIAELSRYGSSEDRRS